jgi:hypothetical protein
VACEFLSAKAVTDVPHFAIFLIPCLGRGT